MLGAMDDSSKFWRDENRWPRDTLEFSFICRAVLLVGKTLFADEWTNREACIKLVQKIPSIPQLVREGDRFEIYNQLTQKRPDLDLPILASSEYVHLRHEFTTEQWGAAVAIYEEMHRSTEPPSRRFNLAQKNLFEALASGQVISSLRPKPGGDFLPPLAISLWNTENWRNRFYWGQMNPYDPFGNGVGGERYHWIFIETKSLSAFLKTLREPIETTQGTAGGEAKCTSWLTEKMKESPNAKTKPKAAFQIEALEQFSISNKGFGRSWSKAISQTGANWNKAGRTKVTN